jgi:hypothetical protein
MTLPDIVYVVRFSRHSEELRHSLRSLVNLPHGKVWLAGHKPEWATGVEHIKTARKPGAHVDAKTNLRAACEHPDVSEEFIYMNDDFFVMQPFEQLPVMHRGPLSGVGGMATAYQRAIKKGLAILRSKGIEEPLMYDLHAPMTVTKAGMLEALDLCHAHKDARVGHGLHERTIYGNLNDVGGEKHHNFKVYRQDRGWRSWPFISTNDNTFRTQPVGEFIRARFPTQSEYEATPAPKARAPRQVVTGRRAIRRHASSTIRTIQRRTAA